MAAQKRSKASKRRTSTMKAVGRERRPRWARRHQFAEAVGKRRVGIPLLLSPAARTPSFPPESEVVDRPFDLDTLAQRIEAALARS